MELDFPRSDGYTLRHHLIQLESMTKKRKRHRLANGREVSLDPQVHSEWTADIYAIFSQLSRARGGSAISFSEIKAWSDLTGHKLDELELTTIQVFDSVLLDHKYQVAAQEHAKSN